MVLERAASPGMTRRSVIVPAQLTQRDSTNGSGGIAR
jgi:hypothetical protein